MNITTLITIIGIATAGTFLSLCGLHVYWAVRRSGASAAVIPLREGQPLFTPTPATALFVALALLICALLVLGMLGIARFGLPDWPFRIGVCGVAAAFLLRAIGDFRYLGLFKTVRDTAFARNDSWFYSPLCIVIAINCVLLGVLR
jgi:hypothetical protein